MIAHHWDDIAAYCKPENKASLGFVGGLNNEIRAIQRRSYGLRDASPKFHLTDICTQFCQRKPE